MNKTKRRIFNTAIKLFATKGFDNSGIEEITAVSGVAKGSLYYHFKTKEEIFDTLLYGGYNLLINSIEIKFRHRQTAKEKLEAILLVLMKVVVLYEEFFMVMLSNSLGETDKTIKCRNTIDKLVDKIAEVIQEGMDNGEFKEGDSKALAYFVFGTAYSSILYRISEDRTPQSNELYDSLINNMLDGILKK